MKRLIFCAAIIIFALIGEISCIIKFINSDFEPSYKREIVYGIGMVTGGGVFIGYLNIEDNKK